MSTLGKRLREERERLNLVQGAFGHLVGVKKNAQINYEADRRSPTGDYLVAAAAAGVDVLYVLTGVRAAPMPSGSAEERLTDDRRGPIDPILFKICGDLVFQEYSKAGVDLPPIAQSMEAVWAYNEMMPRLADPSDGDELEATLPQIRHLLRKRLAERGQ